MAHHVPPRHRIDAFLRLDGTGTHEAIGDYSSTPVRFTWTPLENRTAHIHRMIISVQDTGAFDAAKYGNNLTLTSGVSLTVRNVADDSQAHSYTVEPIKVNAGWAAHCYDTDVKTWGTGDEILIARWTFSRAGSPMILKDTDYVSIDLNDTFVNLVAHRFVIQGEYV